MKKREMAILVCTVIMIGATACSSQKDVPVESSANNTEATADTQNSEEEKEQSREETSAEETSVEEISIEEISVEQSSSEQASAEESAEWLIENADLNGHVSSFSDTEISIAVATTQTDGNGGEIMIAAAPGSEKEEDLVQVTLAENTVIQILTIDRKSQTKLSLSDVDKSSIKEQGSLLVYGSCQNTNQWTADRVIIVKYV